MARATLRLAHRGPDEPGPEVPCRVLHHQAGGQVRPPRWASAPDAARPAPSGPRTRGCSPRRWERPSRPPGPAGRRPDRRPCRCRHPTYAPAHPASPRFSGIGLRRAREPAVGLEVDAATPGSRAARSSPGIDAAARAAHAVERHVEACGPGSRPRRSSGSASTGARCFATASGSCRHHPDPVPARTRRPLLRQRAHRAPRLGIEEDPVGTDELERVPLDRVVARREDQPRTGVMLLHRELHRGRRHDARGRARPRPPTSSPAMAACVNIGPLVRASRPSTTSGLPASRAQAPSAAAWRATSSGVRSVPTWPRMPDTLIIRVEDMSFQDSSRGQARAVPAASQRAAAIRTVRGVRFRLPLNEWPTP